MTPRSYSRRIFAYEPMKMTTAITTTKTSAESIEIIASLPRERPLPPRVA